MTTLNDFNYVDDSDDVMAVHVNNLVAASMRSEYKNVESLSATRTLLDVDTPIQRFDCNGANRIVKLPTADAVENHPYLIVNSTASGSYTLTVQNNGATIAYAVLNPSEFIFMLPDGDGTYFPFSEGGSGGVFQGGHLFGLGLSNNVTDATNDIDIGAGEARDSTNVADMKLASALTKRLDAAWAVGTNQGGLDTGSIANTTYHVWLIKRSDTGVVDILFSTSASSPTMPTNYDYKRRIGSILRESAAIVLFKQDGDTFMRDLPKEDVSVTNPGTSAVTRTLSVPVGIRVGAIISVLGYGTSAAANPRGIYISDLSLGDYAATTVRATLNVYTDDAGITQLGAIARVFTNTSAQVRSRIQVSAAGTGLIIGTHGWVDNRGRDA